MMLDRQRRVLGEELDKVRARKVCVVGVGAIGSSIALNLARNGFERLVLVDPDKVEEENLGTQEYTRDHLGMNKVDALAGIIRRINPEARVRAVPERFQQAGKKVLECDVVLDGLDTMRDRFELNALVRRGGGEYVMAACAGLSGMTAYFSNTCLECVFPDRKVAETACSPGVCDTNIRAIGVLPETARTAAALATSLLITGQKDVLVGFGIKTGSMEKIRLKKRTGCPVCGQKVE